MKKKVKYTFSIHHWCGLIAGILILVISLTGSILVFDDDLDQTIFAKEFTLASPAGKLSIDASLEKVRAAHPDWEIRIPQLPSSPNQALLYELRKGKLRQWVFAHPETGEIISTNTKAHYRLTQILLDLHYNLLSGTTGKIVVFFVGIALLTLTVTGFILYRKSILKVITFRQKISFKSRRTLYSSLHRVVGVWALAFNLLLCATGLTLSVVVIQHALTAGTPTVATPRITASVDAAMAGVNSAYPDFEITYVRIPTNKEGQVYFLGRLNSDPLYYGVYYSSIPVNYTTGEPGTPHLLRDQPLLKRIVTILQATHFGDYAGYVVKIIYCIGGLLPGILSVSGFFIWYLKTNPAPVAKRSKPARRMANL